MGLNCYMEKNGREGSAWHSDVGIFSKWTAINSYHSRASGKESTHTHRVTHRPAQYVARHAGP